MKAACGEEWAKTSLRFEAQYFGIKMTCQFIRDFLFYSKLSWVLNHMVLTQKEELYIRQDTIKEHNNPKLIDTLNVENFVLQK